MLLAMPERNPEDRFVGKRSSFPRRKQDAYDTPPEAVPALLRQLRPGASFIEPCAGAGHLATHLTRAGHRCVAAFDVKPRPSLGLVIGRRDALKAWVADCAGQADYFITNPPWTRAILHPLILSLAPVLPTWLLFDADWPHTVQAVPYLPLLHRIVAVGRLRWIEGSEHSAKDNAAWYLFDEPRLPGVEITFHGRRA